jgi:hypothetical protein
MELEFWWWNKLFNSKSTITIISNAGNISITTKITNSSGCENTVLKTIHVHELPNVNAGADAAICRIRHTICKQLEQKRTLGMVI